MNITKNFTKFKKDYYYRFKGKERPSFWPLISSMDYMLDGCWHVCLGTDKYSNYEARFICGEVQREWIQDDIELWEECENPLRDKEPFFEVGKYYKAKEGKRTNAYVKDMKSFFDGNWHRCDTISAYIKCGASFEKVEELWNWYCPNENPEDFYEKSDTLPQFFEIGRYYRWKNPDNTGLNPNIFKDGNWHLCESIIFDNNILKLCFEKSIEYTLHISYTLYSNVDFEKYYEKKDCAPSFIVGVLPKDDDKMLMNLDTYTNIMCHQIMHTTSVPLIHKNNLFIKQKEVKKLKIKEHFVPITICKKEFKKLKVKE